MNEIIVHIIGTAQDGGYPQIGCKEKCCTLALKNQLLSRFPSCIALVDTEAQKYWLFDVTPDIKKQLQMLDSYDCSLAGVFITHAHIGHYMGLINFGLEVMNLDEMPVYVMPKMKSFLETNSIMDQLIRNDNINLIELTQEEYYAIDGAMIKPFNVPHRNELSETVGFQIKGKEKSIIYLPDIDSWDGWEENLLDLIKSNDILFLDGTFFSKDELKSRDISKVPHPSITDTMARLSDLDLEQKRKIHFIHFNHTNQVLHDESDAANSVIENGFLLSKEMQSFKIS